MRRRILKACAIGGGVLAFPAGNSRVAESALPEQRDDGPKRIFLPADRAVPGEPQQETDGETVGSPTLERGRTTADSQGTIGLEVGGSLDGEGTFSAEASPYLESTWVPGESGEYLLRGEYSVDGTARQVADEAGSASAATFHRSNLSVVDPEGVVLGQSTAQDHDAFNENYLPELLEDAFHLAARALLARRLPLVGSLIARVFLPALFDELFDERGRESKRIAEDGEISVEVPVEAGREYRVRFTSVGGFAGKSGSTRSGFEAAVTASTSLDRVTAASTGSGRTEHTLTVTKEGADDGFGAYLLTTTGDVWEEADSEAVIDGSKALDFVGPNSGTDILRFGGDVENFLLKGPATVLVDGEEVDPNELGRAEELSNELTVESTGEDTGFYAITVSGSIVPGEGPDSEAFVRGKSALDWVGAQSGTDRFRYSGEIVDFVTKGPVEVSVNGEQRDPDDLGL